MKRQSGRVGVIGGGLGGLAAAVTLAARGYDVVLLERSAWLGGKAAVMKEQGFRFDMGPTIVTVPSILARIVAETGRNLQQELDLVPLDPQWRSFFADGSTLDLHVDTEKMMRAIGQFSENPNDAESYRAFMKFSADLHEISEKHFFWRSIGALNDMFSWRSMCQPSMLKEVMRMRPGSTVSGAIRSHVKDERIAQMLDHFTQYVGSAPDMSPAVLCGIAHMQTGEGVWYPRGGVRAIPELLHQLCIDLGVEIHTEKEVRRIDFSSTGKVRGIESADGEYFSTAAVICNSDTVVAHRDLLRHQSAARFLRRNHEPACSGVVLYLGLAERYNHLLHHNFVFSDDHHEEFENIYRRGEPAPDPTCYVCAPAQTDESVAPDSGEALYVLVHTPYLRGYHDWKKMFPGYRNTIMQKLARTAGLFDLEQRIVVERWLTPQDIQDRYHVMKGAIYGLASHGRYFGAFKPANRSKDIEGLYFAGGSAHPGPGMPMVLMSGWIAADALDQDRIVAPSVSSPSQAEALVENA